MLKILVERFEVEVNEGVATFKVDIFQISTFTIGEPGEPYCTIPIKSLKLLNKFWGTTMRLSFVNARRIFYFQLIRSTIRLIFD